ncbi:MULTISPECIES: pilus assembly PilX N-terminal domain-containing protein [Thalassotalea]|uniref:pilus assembly PilX N-terminal domain-containing protein n=1 Tax=Thalassotalea TaxID=1518149 RepID=UPI0009449928|nr:MULTISPECIES: pilus assembly PilX N-terminal domain-containing protein [Thalassotalea]OKY24861.1 hypothetical protein BI291_04685 [Thalassotalea sp. PP2-459]
MNRKQLRGSALVIAIFVIVVMSLLGVALVKMLRTSSNTVVYEVLGTRAFHAAQTGMQWQLNKLFPLNNPAQRCTSFGPAPRIDSVDGFQNCQVINTTCEDNIEVSGVRYYRLTSTGSCAVDDVVTSRTIEVQARSL